MKYTCTPGFFRDLILCKDAIRRNLERGLQELHPVVWSAPKSASGSIELQMIVNHVVLAILKSIHLAKGFCHNIISLHISNLYQHEWKYFPVGSFSLAQMITFRAPTELIKTPPSNVSSQMLCCSRCHCHNVNSSNSAL